MANSPTDDSRFSRSEIVMIAKVITREPIGEDCRNRNSNYSLTRLVSQWSF